MESSLLLQRILGNNHFHFAECFFVEIKTCPYDYRIHIMNCGPVEMALDQLILESTGKIDAYFYIATMILYTCTWILPARGGGEQPPDRQ